MKKNLLLICAIIFFQLLVTSAVFAQPWAEAMFQEHRHSFGSVTLGSESVYRFQFKNPYSDDIHIASVRSSCACTTPDWPKTAIKFGETAEIVAKLNTDGQYTGERKATLTVVIDRPSRAEVQLQVTGFIRSDVVISPGRAEFGSISEGSSTQKVLTLQYAGRSNWKLTHVECSNPHIQVDADNVERKDGRIEYKILVTIKNTMPSGYIHDMVRFTTNDTTPNASVILIPVHGFVTAPLVAKPSPLVVGFVQPGETVKKKIVLHSDVPFRITKVTSKDRRFQFSLSDDKDAKTNSIHVLPIAFTADTSLGVLNEPIIIHTTLAGQKQVQLQTQGMVYDVSLLDEYRGRLKHQFAGQSQEQSPEQLSGQEKPMDLPPATHEGTRIAGLPHQGMPRLEIHMGPSGTVFQDVSPQKKSNTIAINMNPEENRSEEIAVVAIDVADNSHKTNEIAVVQQENSTASLPGLKVVPRLASDEPVVSQEAFSTVTPPQTVMRQESDISSIPATTRKQQPVKDPVEVPFEAMTEPAIQRMNSGLPAPTSTVRMQNPGTQLPSGFQMVEDIPARQQPLSPNVHAQTVNDPVDHGPAATVEQSAVEQTYIGASRNSSLPFSTPSVRDNLEAFTRPNLQPVINSDNAVFAIVDDVQNTVPGNGNALQTGVTPNNAVVRNTPKIISVTPPPQIPPVPEMTPTQLPVVSPFTSALVAPENDSIGPAEVPLQISNQSSHRLSPPSLPITPNAPPDLDSDLIAEMFGETKISDTVSDASNPAVAQKFGQNENHDMHDGLKPMELQPFHLVSPGTLNTQRMTISPVLEEEYDEWVEEQPGLGQPGVVLPPFEKSPRMNATNNRGLVTLDDDLSPNMMNLSAVPGQGQIGPTDIVKGAPIPTMPPPRQPGPNRIPPNNTPNMSVQRMPQSPGNAPQRPGVPQPGNSPQTAQMQSTPPRLTPQQIQQMQRVQQMQEMQRQRQAIAGQQAGRTATPPQQNRVAQTSPRSPQQPLVVPPAPTVPNAPLMAPAPMFR